MLCRALERSGFEIELIGSGSSDGRRRGLPPRGRAVVKETENSREVLDIWRHQLALWNVSVAIGPGLKGRIKAAQFAY